MAHAKPKHVERITSYLAAFATADPEAVLEHVHTTFQNTHLGILGQGCVGKEVYRSRLAGFLSQFLNIEYRPLAVIADAQSGSARYEFSFQQNGMDYCISGIMWFEFADGLIAHRIDCWDGLNFVKQAKMSADEIAALLSGGA